MPYDQDVFISYTHIDNRPLGAEQQGWIAMLEQALATRLAMLLGEDPRIWRDKKLGGNDHFDREIVDHLVRAATLQVRREAAASPTGSLSTLRTGALATTTPTLTAPTLTRATTAPTLTPTTTTRTPTLSTATLNTLTRSGGGTLTTGAVTNDLVKSLTTPTTTVTPTTTTKIIFST